MKKPRITPAEERELILRAQAGDQAATTALVNAHEGMITTILAKYGRGHVIAGGYDELKQSAYLGFLEGVKRFDPSQGNRLMTYASFWIQHEIDQELAVSRGGISLHREADDLRRHILNSQYALYQRNQVWPSYEEVAEDVQRKLPSAVISAARVETILQAATDMKPLDSRFFESDDVDTMYEVIPDENSVEPLTFLIDRERRQESYEQALGPAWTALEALGDQTREIVMRRYGIFPFDFNPEVAQMNEGSKYRSPSERDPALLGAEIIARQMNLPLRTVTTSLANAQRTMEVAVRNAQ